jgi:hypothetical protein
MNRDEEEPLTRDSADRNAPEKRAYVPPRLERLGTLEELTQGAGMNNNFDGASPPGQNKSRL